MQFRDLLELTSAMQETPRSKTCNPLASPKAACGISRSVFRPRCEIHPVRNFLAQKLSRATPCPWSSNLSPTWRNPPCGPRKRQGREMGATPPPPRQAAATPQGGRDTPPPSSKPATSTPQHQNRTHATPLIDVEDCTPASKRPRWSASGGTPTTRWRSRAQSRSPQEQGPLCGIKQMLFNDGFSPASSRGTEVSYDDEWLAPSMPDTESTITCSTEGSGCCTPVADLMLVSTP